MNAVADPAHPAVPAFDAAALDDALRQTIAGEVRFEAGSRALYATDASNYRHVPVGVVVPRSVDDIITTVALARRFDAPLLMRGGGTSLAGQTCNVAIVLDTSKYLNRIHAIDPDSRSAAVEPGVVCNVLGLAAAEHGLTFGPDPSTHARCTLGGMIGNNACGAHSVMAGKTDENIETLDVLTYDGVRMTVGPTTEEELAAIIDTGDRRGEIYAGLKSLRDRYAETIRQGFPRIRRRVSGYNLDALLPENGFNVARALVGTEGTCAITLGARTRLVENPRHRVLAVLGYPDICAAGDAGPAVVATGALCCEGLDEQIIGDMRKKGFGLDAIAELPMGNAWLLLEYGGATPEEAEHNAREAITTLAADTLDHRVITDPGEQRTVWSVRESGAAATNAVPGEAETYPGWEDAAVDPAHVGDYLRDYRELLARYGYRSSLYGHFGDGCIHGRVDFDLMSRNGVAKWRRFTEAAADLVVRYGGSLSGEHGDGQARAELWPKMFGPELMTAFREFKHIWDPENRLNPGRLIDPEPFDTNLRTGPDYAPIDPPTEFAFVRDEGSFAKAAGRCVGVGKCRRHAGGVMCPSYRATGEERHSTRGRARLLFEMLQGDPLEKPWNSDYVKDSLDLCLACKGCRHECPVQVDMATYKAEFMAHYYRHHPRPRQAYTLGWIHRWAPLAGAAPRLVNALTQTPGLARLAKAVAGVAPRRALPAFSRRPFTRDFRPAADDGRPAVMLWADTFNNYLHADTARAAADVLAQAGFRVTLPERRACCGRPLHDHGRIDQAKAALADSMAALAPAIEAEIPVVGLEPSCLGSFRDELPNLFPNDGRARWLAENSYLLPDFLASRETLDLPQLEGRALVHLHCHQRALFGVAGTRRLLERLGLEVEILDSGCCGMAGAFGFDPDKIEVSLKVGEEVLLPAVRGADAQTLIVSDGYSCREQIAQTTERRALHTAEVLALAYGIRCGARA
ncbi:FAD-binding and (Fe-S)-binding domain-containing protein [Arhodomonas sp. AD133]|uniref:FAD-binding and (Fe-S)-binding domain-containing protein n=1 Tax=Arhodomonas sp. AD133 TaxID=3415009 RepID=UPI003EBFA97A